MKNLLFFLAIAMIFSACNTSGDEKQADTENNTGEISLKDLKGEVKIDGSSTVYPMSEAVAEEFLAVAPRVRVTVGLSGTGGGFKKFCRNETDINDASRPIKEKEIEQCSANNIQFLELEVAYDGLTVVVNPENDWVDYLTVEELKKIWEPAAQNNITRWNQIRPEWPDEKIALFGAGTASGTYDYFTEAIVGESGASRGDYTASEDDNVLVQGVSTNKYALGFFGLAYYEENMDKLKAVPVDGGDGPVLPSLETVRNGTYKPLSRPLFIYVNSESARRPEVQAFVRFYLENAGDLAKDVGYVPLPEDLYQEQLKKFESFIQQL